VEQQSKPHGRKTEDVVPEVDKRGVLPVSTSSVNLSAMVERPGRILRWLGRTFFGAVAFDEVHRKTIEDASKKGVPVFVTNVVSLLDYLYFNHAFLVFSLPLVFFASKLNLLLFRPIKGVFGYLIRRIARPLRRLPNDHEMMRHGLTAGKPCLVSLKRNRKLIQWGGDQRLSHLSDLIDIQKRLDRPIILVPLLVVWDKKPESYRRTVFDVVFGDPQAPGRLRKLVSFMLNFRSARTQAGKPVDLRRFIDENKDAAGTDIIAARLKFTLSQEFLLEAKAIRGPALKGAHKVVDEIMRTPPFIEEIRQLAAENGLDEESEKRRARSMLMQMAADFRFGWLEGFAFILGLLFQRIFQGIVVDTRGLDRIREAARDAPMVMLPAHRSHIDYLLLSEICYTHGLLTPHIASGDNLSFWPMGPIFRHCGAFFIKRVFRQDALYKAVLSQYVRKLLKEGYWIEFFIEGTRSRSGKSLNPRYGMLNMVVDGVASGAAPDVNLMPVAVTYEKVIEEKSYQAETAGTEKQKESAMALAGSAKVLGARYGKVYIEFDRPLSLVEFLRSQGVRVPLGSNEKVPREIVRRLAHIVVHRINLCFVVTPYHIVSFALLTHPKRGMGYSTLLTKVGWLVTRLAASGANLSDLVLDPLRDKGLVNDDATTQPMLLDVEGKRHEEVGSALRHEVDNVLKLFVKDKSIKVREFEGDWVLSVTDDKRSALDYYKNGIIHFFIDVSLLAFSVLKAEKTGDTNTANLRDSTKALSRLFKFEFIYGADRSFEDIFDSTVRSFIDESLLQLDGDMISVGSKARENIEYFADMVLPFVESYRILGKSICQDDVKDMSDKDIIRSAVKFGRRMFSVGEISLSESVSTVLFSNALKYLRSEVARGRSLDIDSAASGMLELLGESTVHS